MVLRMIFLLAALVVAIDSFTVPVPLTSSALTSNMRMSDQVKTSTTLYEKGGASKSGNKRDRLNKLAELQENEVVSDKGFVLKAAGAFVGLIVILVGVGAASGVFDQLLINNAVRN
jgi:hypothetical protein